MPDPKMKAAYVDEDDNKRLERWRFPTGTEEEDKEVRRMAAMTPAERRAYDREYFAGVAERRRKKRQESGGALAQVAALKGDK